MTNVLQFNPKANPKEYMDNGECECILLVDHEETRQTIKTAFGIDTMKTSRNWNNISRIIVYLLIIIVYNYPYNKVLTTEAL